MTAAFVPALGRPGLTRFYDPALRLATREAVWRQALVEQIALRPNETLIDVGCGTGTLAILLKRGAPSARVIGLDPDEEALSIARAKAAAAGVDVEWCRGYARDAACVLGSGRADKSVSSLVFHQVPPDEKRRGFAAMFAAVRADGEVHVADYARQDAPLMRLLFGVIGRLDGAANTQPNADGMLERLFAELSGTPVTARRVVHTPTGAISLFRCERPVDGERP